MISSFTAVLHRLSNLKSQPTAFEEMKPILVTAMPVVLHCVSLRVPALEKAVEMNV